MNCNKCGTFNAIEAKFCIKCGNNLQQQNLNNSQQYNMDSI